MTIDELKASLTSDGLFPIHVEDDREPGLDTCLDFVGDLEEYIQAIKALGIAYVFVSSNTVREDDFHHEADEDDDDEYPNDDTDLEFFLPDISPELNQFREYVGRDCQLTLSTPIPSGSLRFLIEEPWWTHFLEMREAVIDKIEDDREAVLKQKHAARKAKEKDLLNQLKGLIKEEDFVSLPTQKAMRAYAIERIPELESLDSRTVKDEIQEISAKIKAKGLGKKRK